MVLVCLIMIIEKQNENENKKQSNNIQIKTKQNKMLYLLFWIVYYNLPLLNDIKNGNNEMCYV